MSSSEQLKLIANFLVDGAKIIFGSLVMGIFSPRLSGSMPWTTFFVSLFLTLVFLGIAVNLSKPNGKNYKS